MKSFLLGKPCLILILLLFFASSALAGMIQDNSILSETIGQGRVQLDTGFSYSTAGEIFNLSGPEPKWISLSDVGLDSVTYSYVPLRITYGLLDNLSLRLTLPYASLEIKPKSGPTTTASGLANVELEGLCKLLRESETSPSIATLLRVKFGTGKKLAELKANEAYVGTRSTDFMLGWIIGKNFGSVDWKMLVGYLMTTPYKEDLGFGNIDVDLTDQIISSFMLAFPLSRQFEVSGEIWLALSQGKEKWDKTEVDKSNRDSTIFTPAFKYEIADGFVLRGSADLVLSKTPALTLNVQDWYKYTTYTIGATISL